MRLAAVLINVPYGASSPEQAAEGYGSSYCLNTMQAWYSRLSVDGFAHG